MPKELHINQGNGTQTSATNGKAIPFLMQAPLTQKRDNDAGGGETALSITEFLLMVLSLVDAFHPT